MELCQKNGVSYYRSELIPCPHGFSTRLGGVSREPHTASLNLAFGRGDAAETVLENLERFAAAVGVPASSVVSLPQVHGNDVIRVTAEDCGEGYFRASDREADGYVTTDPSVSLGIKTADCVPILLCGCAQDGTPLAVSALHAGWRGTVARIAQNGVKALNGLGIPSGQIRAAIGPAIGMCCYEVDAPFRETFYAAFGAGFLDGTFIATEKEGKFSADLTEINRRILMDAGVPEHAIDASAPCTCCHTELFFSHRYSSGKRGTMLSLIALQGEEMS